MLEHGTGAERSYISTANLASAADAPVEALPDAVCESIEDYLERVCKPLMKYTEYAESSEQRSEMRAHLEALTLAHMELDSTPEEAVRSALRQFGAPKLVMRRCLREWELAHLAAPTRSARPAMRWALPRYALYAIIAGITIYGFDKNWRMLGLSDVGLNRLVLVLLCLCVLPPFLIGFATGLRARSRSVLGTFYAQALTIPLISIVPGLVAYVFPHFLQHRIPILILIPSLFLTAILTPVGCLGAFCGSLLRTVRARLLAAR